MHPFDLSLIVLYVIGLLAIGLYFSRRASQSAEDYFLAGRKTPWWVLGTSGMTSNLDVAGTMTIVSMIYLFGVHGFFIEMRGGVVLPIAVFLAFMGKWHRRSGVMTTAEWMALRFGRGRDATLARVLAALTYIVIAVFMVIFFLTAAAQFLSVFLPLTPVQAATAMAIAGLVYTLLSGLYGVLWTDFFQSLFIGIAALYVAFIGWMLLDSDILARWPGAAFNEALPRITDPALGEFSLFWFFLIAFAGKGILEGLGGSGGSAYMAQRFYATSSDRDCQKIGMLWIGLFAFRWPMAVGFAILAVHLGLEQVADSTDQILPLVLQSEFFPVGIQGLVVVALFAASMSTFDSTVNAGASYVVRDLYQPLRNQMGSREAVWVGYAASALIVAAGLGISLLLTESVLGVWVLIVVQLFPAFLVPFALRWFWARFNATGFNLSILAGFLTSAFMVWHPAGEGFDAATTIFTVSLLSLLGAVLGTALGPATPKAVQRTFFDRVRPFGLWPAGWKADCRTEHRRDLIRLPVALLWQTCTFLGLILIVLGNYREVLLTGILWVSLLVYLVRDLKHSASKAVTQSNWSSG